jgi:hypothetical protein
MWAISETSVGNSYSEGYFMGSGLYGSVGGEDV